MGKRRPLNFIADAGVVCAPQAMCPTVLHFKHILFMSYDLIMPPFSACGGSWGVHWFLGGL